MAMMLMASLFDIDGHRANNYDVIGGILRQELSMTITTTGPAAHADDSNDMFVNSV